MHLPAYDCTFSSCNREAVTAVNRHTKLFALCRAFGDLRAAFLRTEVSHFFSTLLSPVDRGSERCVWLSTGSCSAAFSPTKTFADRFQRGARSDIFSFFLHLYLREKSRLLKCWGLPCLRRDMVAGGGGVQRGSHRGEPGLERRLRWGKKYLHPTPLTSTREKKIK